MYTQVTCRNCRCTQTTHGMLRLDKTIRALLDSLNVLSILSTRFWVSFVSIKVIHTMHTSTYFVILILYFCELWPFGTYNPNKRTLYVSEITIYFMRYAFIGSKCPNVSGVQGKSLNTTQSS